MSIVKSCLVVLVCVAFLGGCAASSSPTKASSSDAKNVTTTSTASTTSLAETADASKAIQESFIATSEELLAKLSRTVMPSKAKPKVFKSGKSYVAQYTAIDRSSVYRGIRKGTRSATPYLGYVEYTEVTKMCRGATKAKAIASSDCSSSNQTRRKEMMHYDGKKWNF